ncbi:MAG: putative glycosyltransferase [Nitrosomonadaceae bacterium]|nr:putative glycosyltransferase [Nitrosomonadaceae bacterium]
MKFSVVTPSYNQASFLRENVESVLRQRKDGYDIEHIVIDGGSTDGTREILESYPHLIWVSEPDRGQADAVNKGFARATGEIVGWINSDDYYVDGAFSRVAEFLVHNLDIDMVYGRCRLVDTDSRFLREWNPTEFKWNYLVWRGASLIPQQTVFLRRRVIESMEYMCDVTIQDAMDYDLWLRIGRRFRVRKIDRVLACFRLHAAAKTAIRPLLQWQESRMARDRYNPYGPIITRIGCCYYLARRVCEKIVQKFSESASDDLPRPRGD